ncbi:DUF1605-domain-containing protein [Basidiobolus meristosporus CBS 931.73]|uniref:DUF1605-domain-containing protein n=1 Tax=Basidiobolus meristosporus CBS 931.73 TaxID=1314790 RepID=A0A1Y1Y1M2_9FUNG|nr:DUF1605-domain-containing protein [Basidiobolus meristosporus CBS 931.73]|eukprot:ORX91616.1 DUF1605-domain-containing protein [Basidiobolus meristosporus CBS 931.73]
MDLKSWVSDNVFKFLGLSSKEVVEYLISSAKKSSSPEQLYSTLKNEGFSASDAAKNFASELYSRVPHQAPSSKRKVERAEEPRSSKVSKTSLPKVGVISEDTTLIDVNISSKKNKGKQLRKREDDGQWDSDEEQINRYQPTEDSSVDPETEFQNAEEQRMQDLKERDEFAERLKNKDLEKTKKLIEDRSGKNEAEAAKRRNLADDPEARKSALPNIRERSRQQYLKLREEQRLELLRRKIEDEEVLFRDEKLTKKEIEAHEYNKEVLRLAEERLKIDDKVDGYVMPEDYITEKGKIDRKKKEEVLYKRYEEDQNQKFVSEQDQWEMSQINKSQLKVGAKDRPRHDEQDDYDYVFDEQQIDFILQSTLNEKAQEEEGEKIKVRKSLPIYSYRQQLVDAIAEHQVLIIVGETGSGKTTQLPQYLYEEGYTKGGKKVGCTQPRRVAAMSVAARVAEEMGVKLGYEVDCTSDKTVMKYMTDGMLLHLSSYTHERTLHTDILFGLVKDIARYRPDLKLLISSATMDAQKFSEYFDNAPIFMIPGRPFPVEVYYTKAPEANYLQAAITTIMQIHVTQGKGDILIESAHESLQQTCRVLGSKIKELIICPIYSSLPSEMQGKIFEPTPEGARKTSITVDGIVYVIDPGFAKQKCYNPRNGMEASADQRAGRAGRWSYFNEMEMNTIPEIQRSNLGNTVLLLKSLGINDLIEFDFMDPPPAETLIRALNDRGELTKLGRRMAELPTDPMLAKTIVASEDFNCSEEILSICAMLTVQNSKFHADKARQNLTHPEGDHLTLLNVWNQWWCYENFIQYRSMTKARDVRDQLIGLVERIEIVPVSNPNSSDTTPIKKALTAGFFCNAARLQRSGDAYRTAKHNQTVNIHPSSGLFEERPKWVMYFELVFTTREFMRQVTEIKPEWLLELAPHYYKAKDIEEDTKRKMPKAPR